MPVILLAVGLATVLAGAVMVGFGIENNGFGIGNTLISAGTTALVGGLVLIGLSAVVRQLRALAELLEVPAPPPAIGNGVTPAADALARVRARALRGSVTVPSAAASEEARQDLAAAENYQQPTDVRSPRRGVRTMRSFEPPSSRASATHETTDHEAEHADSETTDRDLGEAPPPVSPYAPSRPGLLQREPRRQRDVGTVRGSETLRRSETAPSTESGAMGREDQPYGHEGRGVGAAPEAGAHGHEVAPSGDQAPAATGGDHVGLSILKSGVIDGMAYTLYTDGSIEAEMPQGTLKFDSIDGLRDYLASKE